MDVLAAFVFALLRQVLPEHAVDDVAIVVDDEDVLNADVFVVQQWVFETTDHIDEVLYALNAFQSERDAGRDRLLLLDDHFGVSLYGTQVEVVLDAKGQTEHQCEEQQQAGPEAFYDGGKSHIGSGARVLRSFSSELCIINYFFVARGRGPMLYLWRSQINVPRDRRLGNSSHLNVAVS